MSNPTWVPCSIVLLVDPWGTNYSAVTAFRMARRYINKTDMLFRQAKQTRSSWLYFTQTVHRATCISNTSRLREFTGWALDLVTPYPHCNGLVRLYLDRNEVYDIQVKNGELMEPIKRGGAI